jgi:D-3-phosphoglycerate dehydrogenase / 2-oxoglutarate reductase
MRILIAEPKDFSARALARLQQLGQVELREVDKDGLQQAFSEYEVVWLRLGHRVRASDFGAAPRCRILAVPATGLDHLDLEAAARLGVRVVSLRGETDFLRNVRATAELTIGLLLALVRRIPNARDAVRCGSWNRDAFRGHELFERTAGIVGVGRLGTLVAEYLSAMGMKVLGYDPHASAFPSGVRRMESLRALLGVSDVVSLHASYDASTHHLIGPGEIRAMQPHAVLVNTARGGLVDEQALLEALREGRLTGAALDVLQGEPHIDASHSLVAASKQLDNLLIVPHIGGSTYESLEKAECFVAERVAAAARELAP